MRSASCISVIDIHDNSKSYMLAQHFTLGISAGTLYNTKYRYQMGKSIVLEMYIIVSKKLLLRFKIYI